MIFLIEYDPKKQSLVTFKKFTDSEREKAQKSRFEIEMKLNKSDVIHEVLILEAGSEQDLRKTHRRYFESVGEIVKLMQYQLSSHKPKKNG